MLRFVWSDPSAFALAAKAHETRIGTLSDQLGAYRFSMLARLKATFRIPRSAIAGSHMIRIVASKDILRTALDQTRRTPGRTLEWSISRSDLGKSQELILCPFSSTSYAERTIRIVLGHDISAPRTVAGTTSAILMIGRRRQGAAVAAYLVHDGVPFPQIGSLYLPGPGMHQIPLESDVVLPGESGTRMELDHGRLSRSKGVLGPAWERLISLKYTLVGIGRTGSLMAGMLTRLGVRELTLVDFDTLEEGDLGETADFLTEDDVHEPKVQAVAHHLCEINPDVVVHTVQESITGLGALHAIKASDFVICTTDHSSARLAAACAASLYARPMLDIGTGIEQDGRIGLTVRLTLPGQCLLCFGGLDVENSWTIMKSSSTERDFHAKRIWAHERQGSLASLNQLGAALGQRMIEDLAAERLAGSTWLHLAARGIRQWPYARVIPNCQRITLRALHYINWPRRCWTVRCARVDAKDGTLATATNGGS